MFQSVARHAACEVFVRMTIRKKSLKTYRRKFRRYFPGISVPSETAIQDLVKKFCETDSVVDKKIKSLGYCERKSIR